MKLHLDRVTYLTLPPLGSHEPNSLQHSRPPMEISWIVLRDPSPPVVTLSHVPLKQPLTMSQGAKSTMVNLTRNEVKAARAVDVYLSLWVEPCFRSRISVDLDMLQQ